jgi:hypothetical protein
METSLTGKDTIIINGRVLNDFADGDTCKLDYPNDLSVIKTGKNGNSIYAFQYSGLQCTVDLRILLGGSDDAFLNALLSNFISNPPGFILLTGEFIKNIGDGDGNITPVSYVMSGGSFKKNVPAVENADGDTNQAIATFMLHFTNAPRQVAQ